MPNQTEDGGSVGKYEQDKVQYTGRTLKPRKYKHKAGRDYNLDVTHEISFPISGYERDYLSILQSPPIADYSGGKPDRCEKEKATCNAYNKVW